MHADHGSIQDNHDGTFTPFTRAKITMGKVSFTYDVQDAHGDDTATSAGAMTIPRNQ
ncbi:cadherin-like domain-containing protein [Vibrio chagasii]|nr:cadherin-like domain-containing protein [Vibrio chagasii]